jgi:signal transduction histidine kinase/FixJ family two-component response regulator
MPAVDKANLLVVDDRPDKLLAFSSILEQLEQNVITVQSGEEALKQVLAHDFAVILLDVHMPGMDGLETAALIRKRRKSAHTPIIFITAYADEMHTAQGYSLGAVDYILSPVVPEILCTKVKVFVDLFLMTQEVKRRAEERVALVREQAARVAAEAARRRSAFLAEAAATLASSLDLNTLLAGVSRLVVPFLADLFALILDDAQNGLQRAQVTWSQGGDGEAVRTASLDTSPNTALMEAVERVLASGEVEFLTDPGSWRTSPEEPDSAAPDFLPHLTALFPLRARGRPLGVLCLALGPSGRHYEAADLELADDLASRVAIALDNALLLAREQAARAELAEKAGELLKLNSALERSNSELDAFAYIVSHDLKEPLRGIHNYSQFLIADYADKLDEAGVAKLQTLMRLTQRMQALLDSLFYYSRVGRQDLALAQVDLQQALEEALELLHARVQESGVQISLPRPLPMLLADRARIGEVFSNLIANAIKYNDKSEKRVEIGFTRPACEPGAEAAPPVFYVRDNGIGIDARHAETVFHIFKRLHGRDAYGGGVGAGLTIVKKIVERHGGRIWIESTPGEGSTFHFTLSASGSSP